MARSGSRWTVPVMCAIQFVDVLGIALVIVALPTMAHELQMGASATSLVASVYALLFGACLIPAGRIGDIRGHRRMLMLGLAVFGVASFVGGVAVSAWMVILSRIIQGIGAAIAVPSALALLMAATEEGPERDRALGHWTTAAAAGGASGFAIGGILTDLLGWRSLFFVTLPVVLLALITTPRITPRPEERHSRDEKVDLPSVVLLPAGLILLTFGITRIQDELALTVPILGLLAAGTALVVFTLLRQGRTPYPVLPHTVTRNPELRRASLVAGTITFIAGGINVLISFWLQDVRGMGASLSGIILMLVTLGVILGSRGAPALLTRHGTQPAIILGLVLFAVSVGGFMASLWSGSLAIAGVALAVMGLGLGIAAVASTSLGLSTTGDATKGVAAGLLSAAAPLGSAIGIAIVTTISSWSAARAGDDIAGAQMAIASTIVPILFTSAAMMRTPFTATAHGEGPATSDGG